MRTKVYFICKLLLVLFSVVVFGKLLYNYGCTGSAYEIYGTEDNIFSFSNIESLDWLALLLIGLWVFLLVGPWIQYITMRQKGNHATKNITSRYGLLSALFTVVNIFLAVACIFLNVRFGDEFEVQFGYDRLLYITVFTSLIYMPWSIVVMVMNHHNKYSSSKKWHWILSSTVFVVLGLLAFDGWWNCKYSFSEGRACVCVDGKFGYINRLHQLVIPHIYDNCGHFNNGLAYVGIDYIDDTKYGCIDRNGNIIIPCIYDWCTTPMYDVVYVELNDKYGCFTKKGRESIPLIYDGIDLFYPSNKGLARVKMGDRYGFIRRNGDIEIPISYDYCDIFFADGLIRAQLDGKWGYLDYNGKDIIPFLYDDAGIFKDGRAQVQDGSDVFIIDTKGKKIKED